MKRTILTALATLLLAVPAAQARNGNKAELIPKIGMSDADIAEEPLVSGAPACSGIGLFSGIPNPSEAARTLLFPTGAGDALRGCDASVVSGFSGCSAAARTFGVPPCSAASEKSETAGTVPAPARTGADAMGPNDRIPSGDDAFRIAEINNLFYARALIGDSLPVRLFLESGVVFPLIDSSLVWEHPELFAPVEAEQPVRFRMANGALYRSRYLLPAGLKVGTTRSVRACYIADLRSRGYDLLYPLNTFTTDTVDAPGIFRLDVARHRMQPLTCDALPASGGEWAVYPLVRDEESGMYLIEGTLRLSDAAGRSCAELTELTVDLGNGNLLALFAFKPGVGAFVSRAPVETGAGTLPNGMRMRLLMPEVTTFMERYPFRGFPILLLESPMKLPGDGFLGTRFFREFDVIFDFRNQRLWLKGSE